MKLGWGTEVLDMSRNLKVESVRSRISTNNQKKMETTEEQDKHELAG